MRFALCQINPTVGDLAGNAERILAWAGRAARDGADVAVFPELCVTGYPPQDLLDRPAFLDDVEAAVAFLAAEAPAGLTLILGAPVRNPDPTGKRLLNAVLVVRRGEVVAEAHKALLPTYDVFDEQRYFEPARACVPVEVGGLRLGLHVCEDMWNNVGGPASGTPAMAPLYAVNPIDALGTAGVDVFVNISASPFAAGKQTERAGLIAESCREHGVPFVYVNTVGANTELVFDGDSRVHDAEGRLLVELASFREDYAVWDSEAPGAPIVDVQPDRIAQIHDALVLGIRDYDAKTGAFPRALVGLSGGIDSAVTCALAVAALGPDRVRGITMPSAYSSAGSVSDSEALARALGIEFHEVPIRPAVDTVEGMLAPLFGGTEPGVAEENIQARTRGLVLMAVSNKFGDLLLTTGNKSEMAVGYATLYGDMSGGLAVLSDVFKMDVYALAEHINARAERELIPQSTITKPPSAELRPGQVDQDSLPPYPVLDDILERYVERQHSADRIVRETGHDAGLVVRVARMVDRNEFKRRQAAPGLRISDKAFGSGRRMPIVMRRSRILAGGEAEPVPAA